MPITVSWNDDNKTAILFTYVGGWNWEEFYVSTEQSNALMDCVSHPVDILIDMRNSSAVPKNMLSHLTRLPNIAHPNTGIIVIAGASAILQTLSNVYSRVYGGSTRKFQMVETLEEGRQVIATYQR